MMFSKISRRSMLVGAGGVGLAAMVPQGIRSAAAAGKPLKIGYISPKTGPLSVFGETDDFIVKKIRESLKNGIDTVTGHHSVELVVYDSQSSSSRAAAVVADLIEKDEVNIVLACTTPDTVNPVSDRCELAGVPCVTTAAPWESWYFGRGGTPDKGFDYTYHYFFGLEDAIATYTGIWNEIETNRRVGGLFPNDADGAAWSDAKNGLPARLPKTGYELINPGTFVNNADTFSSHIAAFKKAEVDILTGVVNPPDWNVFWKQARQQGLRPKIVTVAKALVAPAAVLSYGPEADALTTEIVWSPFHPFKSSLTGQTSQSLSDEWRKESGKLWIPSLGWSYSLFEVALDALKRSADPTDYEATTKAVAETDLQTIFGMINFKKGPFGRNVCITPAVGGQWRVSADTGLSLDIISNTTMPAVPVTAKPRLIPN